MAARATIEARQDVSNHPDFFWKPLRRTKDVLDFLGRVDQAFFEATGVNITASSKSDRSCEVKIEIPSYSTKYRKELRKGKASKLVKQKTLGSFVVEFPVLVEDLVTNIKGTYEMLTSHEFDEWFVVERQFAFKPHPNLPNYKPYNK